MPAILSVQTGQVQTRGEFDARDPEHKRWTSAIFKAPVSGPVRVTWLGLEGDAQADLKNHGGPDKAVLAYSGDHFENWKQVTGLESMGPSGFGENLTISGLTEESVCIGDHWQVGSVVLQVTQPRQPCFKLGRRWQTPVLPKLVVANGCTGWYLRVLQEGVVEAGQTLELLDRPHPEWTIKAANQVFYDRHCPAERVTALIAIEELSQAWRDELAERVMA